MLRALGMPSRWHPCPRASSLPEIALLLQEPPHAALLTLKTMICPEIRWLLRPCASHFSSEFPIYDKWALHGHLRCAIQWLKSRLCRTTQTKYVFKNPQGVMIQNLIPVLQSSFLSFPFSPHFPNSAPFSVHLLSRLWDAHTITM